MYCIQLYFLSCIPPFIDFVLPFPPSTPFSLSLITVTVNQHMTTWCVSFVVPPYSFFLPSIPSALSVSVSPPCSLSPSFPPLPPTLSLATCPCSAPSSSFHPFFPVSFLSVSFFSPQDMWVAVVTNKMWGTHTSI
jgi:hypothetical protein